MTDLQEILVSDLVKARINMTVNRSAEARKYYEDMANMLEDALVMLGVENVEMAMFELELKYDK